MVWTVLHLDWYCLIPSSGLAPLFHRQDVQPGSGLTNTSMLGLLYF